VNRSSIPRLAPFDASKYLDNEETIAEYLAAALDNPDPDAFLIAVRDVAKARGIANIAAKAGVGRESLYKTLHPGAKPRFETVRRLLAALGLKLQVSSADKLPDNRNADMFPNADDTGTNRTHSING
jgi:probable addiction module antidote protein